MPNKVNTIAYLTIHEGSEEAINSLIDHLQESDNSIQGLVDFLDNSDESTDNHLELEASIIYLFENEQIHVDNVADCLHHLNKSEAYHGTVVLLPYTFAETTVTNHMFQNGINALGKVKHTDEDDIIALEPCTQTEVIGLGGGLVVLQNHVGSSYGNERKNALEQFKHRVLSVVSNSASHQVPAFSIV